ncbi:hypothetical protein COT97_03725 [Candidatus Falkowbacteria bacterium CG10_big_fil_rev_8_21_14_0_10_39_11]|uniref:Uncharacterized protein n=1 Tax=Candidatus Falkowbacteria bacterium CG10_big_fil_rev_8_21_14_0_10_39_11 TaxID=1974565 RepID=A0A2H0V4I4_9BACT|nr:MAG: hypothetical protein COT97_03725 [Candidatus Falkowbacteria bacterium CG10_big_fil_rev_8_21_14_0_10_39_11]
MASQKIEQRTNHSLRDRLIPVAVALEAGEGLWFLGLIPPDSAAVRDRTVESVVAEILTILVEQLLTNFVDALDRAVRATKAVDEFSIVVTLQLPASTEPIAHGFLLAGHTTGEEGVTRLDVIAVELLYRQRLEVQLNTGDLLEPACGQALIVGRIVVERPRLGHDLETLGDTGLVYEEDETVGRDRIRENRLVSLIVTPVHDLRLDEVGRDVELLVADFEEAGVDHVIDGSRLDVRVGRIVGLNRIVALVLNRSRGFGRGWILVDGFVGAAAHSHGRGSNDSGDHCVKNSVQRKSQNLLTRRTHGSLH